MYSSSGRAKGYRDAGGMGVAKAVAHSLFGDVEQLGRLGRAKEVGSGGIDFNSKLDGSIAAGKGNRLEGGLEFTPIEDFRFRRQRSCARCRWRY